MIRRGLHNVARSGGVFVTVEMEWGEYAPTGKGVRSHLAWDLISGIEWPPAKDRHHDALLL